MESGDPFRLIDVLIKHDVPFVIIGGHAVTYHGYVRATEDTDVVFLRNAAAEVALHEALTELNARWIGNSPQPVIGPARRPSRGKTSVGGTGLALLRAIAAFLKYNAFCWSACYGACLV